VKTNTKRAAAFLLAAVMMGSAWQMPGGAFYTEAKESVISEDGISENSISEDSISEDGISENSISEDSISENSISENSISENSTSEDSISEDSISENSISENSISENSISENSISENSISGNDPAPEETSAAQSGGAAGWEVENDGISAEVTSSISLSDEIRVEGFELAGEKLTYTGGRITQDLRIYHNDTLLKENTDYKLTYKNNINAATRSSDKAPSVTITMKGQYSGSRTLYFTIAPRNIDEDSSQGCEQVIQYSKKLTIPVPSVSCGGRRLTNKKDFVCDYSTLPTNYTQGDAYEDGVVYDYTIRGTGNYTGSFTMQVAVIRDKTLNFGTAAVSVDKKQYAYQGKALSNEDVQIVSVKIGKVTLDPGLYSYSVYAQTAGTGYVEVYPSDAGRAAGYRGMKKVNIKVTGDRSIRDAVSGENWADSVTYSGAAAKSGGICQKSEGILLYPAGDGFTESGSAGGRSEVLTEGVDYTVKYSNNKKTGTATVIFTGMGRYTGTLRKTYKIMPNTELAVQWADTDEAGNPTAVYRKGGAMPAFDLVEVSAGEEVCVLKNKTDYTVKVTNNQTTGTMTCVITGKGNYKGYHKTQNIAVLNGDIAQGTISVSDKPYSARANAWKSAVTITDVNGKKLAAGTDYDRNVTYVYDGMENGLPPQAGVTVYVTAKGINNYAGSSVTESYHIYSVSIGKLIVQIDAQEYTGQEIRLTEKDIHVYADRKSLREGREINDTCYEIEGYSNNIKSGTAKVILGGSGVYGGTKTFSFKISPVRCLVTVTEAEDDGSAPNGRYVTPQNYRSAEDEDDTASFNRAIADLNGTSDDPATLYVPAGTYSINAETGIRLNKNYINLVMSEDAVLRAVGNAQAYYNVILVQEASHITISGGQIVGERYRHKGSSGEWGHGIGIYDCSVITVENVDISACWGDGIYLGTNRTDANTNKEAGCGAITITGCTLHDNRRNNMSVVCADQVTIEGCTMNNAGGTQPGYGLDIESNYEDNPCEKITISGSSFDGNAGGSIGINSSWTSEKPSANNVRIENCTLNGHFVNYAGKNVVISNSRINGETDARMGVSLADGSVINGGEDELVATYSAVDFRITDDYSFHLSDLSTNGKSVLEKGAAYRFEYVVKGSGVWGVKTSQTSGYPCLPASDCFTTGIVTYKAGASKANPCLLTLYAENKTNGMWLEIESIKIYKVK
jgi:hypothetical protein